MPAILDWYKEEGMIFKGGSGSGINVSSIRSSYETLGKSAGTASGPLSFMRGADSSAGAIKSGGKTRRAAKMVVLNVDHPDVEEFIWCKAIEERKARVLQEADFDMDLDGRDSFSVQYQNANNSVRVTDEFMQAVENDDDWNLVGVTDKKVYKTLKARDVWRQILKVHGSVLIQVCSLIPLRTTGTRRQMQVALMAQTLVLNICTSITRPVTSLQLTYSSS